MTGLNEEDLKKNVKEKDTWLRFLFLVVFAFIFYLASTVIYAISMFQFLAKLFSGATFPNLAEFGSRLSLYLAQIVSYLTFASDERPFPFAAFPPKQI